MYYETPYLWSGIPMLNVPHRLGSVVDNKIGNVCTFAGLFLHYTKRKKESTTLLMISGKSSMSVVGISCFFCWFFWKKAQQEFITSA